ncbi:MAG: ATP synthase F0 subunit B [Caldilineaceae bacterium]
MQIIDQLTDMLNNSSKVPFSNNRVVDAAEFSQLLDRLRINVPSSIRDSERTLAERERILAQADEEARRMVAQAQKRAAEMLAADALVQSARREAERIMDEARQASVRSAEDADAYAEYVLNAISDTLANAGGQVTNGLSELSLRRAERAAQTAALHQNSAPSRPASSRSSGNPAGQAAVAGGAPGQGPGVSLSPLTPGYTPQHEAKG